MSRIDSSDWLGQSLASRTSSRNLPGSFQSSSSFCAPGWTQLLPPIPSDMIILLWWRCFRVSVDQLLRFGDLHVLVFFWVPRFPDPRFPFLLRGLRCFFGWKHWSELYYQHYRAWGIAWHGVGQLSMASPEAVG
jgi:hypothetical protein